MTATLPDHRPFLAVIRDRPDDDAPRLRFADWLEEHGEWERAEFVRVQVELAGLGPPAIPEPDPGMKKTTRYDALRRRERELWRDGIGLVIPREAGLVGGWLESEWPTGTADANLTCIVARGFIDSVSLTTRQLIGGQCERCQGQVGRCPHCDGRSVLRVDMSNPGMWCERCWAVTKRSCSDCAGTGTLPGLAAALGQSCPLLTRVVLTDREPGDFFPST